MNITTNNQTLTNNEKVITRESLVLNSLNCIGTILSAAMTVHSAMVLHKMEQAGIQTVSGRTVLSKLRDRRYRRTKSNNWLKMHGYPMRRNVQLRKIHQNQRRRKNA